MSEINFILRSIKSEGNILSLFWFVFLVGLIAVDQITKWWVFTHNNVLVNSWLGVEKFPNSNFAFSLSLPFPLMYTIYTVVIITIIYYCGTSWKQLSKLIKFCWALIFAGAVSNVAERVVHGYVKDFIHVFWGYFNLADVYIVVGVIMLLFFHSKDERY